MLLSTALAAIATQLSNLTALKIMFTEGAADSSMNMVGHFPMGRRLMEILKILIISSDRSQHCFLMVVEASKQTGLLKYHMKGTSNGLYLIMTAGETIHCRDFPQH